MLSPGTPHLCPLKSSWVLHNELWLTVSLSVSVGGLQPGTVRLPLPRDVARRGVGITARYCGRGGTRGFGITYLSWSLFTGKNLAPQGCVGGGLTVSSMARLCLLYPRGSVMQVVASLLRHIKPCCVLSQVLDDEVRACLCPDKIGAERWLEVSDRLKNPSLSWLMLSWLHSYVVLVALVRCFACFIAFESIMACHVVDLHQIVESAHRVGLPTTSTLMFGHIEDGPATWASHLLSIRLDLHLPVGLTKMGIFSSRSPLSRNSFHPLRRLAERTGGITEFVPLPYVHMEAPLYLKVRL